MSIKPYASIEAALASIERRYWRAKLIVGDTYQCYLYFNHSDPNVETNYLAFGESSVSLEDAIHKAVSAHVY